MNQKTNIRLKYLRFINWQFSQHALTVNELQNLLIVNIVIPLFIESVIILRELHAYTLRMPLGSCHKWNKVFYRTYKYFPAIPS